MATIVFGFNDDDDEVGIGCSEGFKPSASQYATIISKIISINVEYDTRCSNTCLACESARKLILEIDKLAEQFVKDDVNIQMMKEGHEYKQ